MTAITPTTIAITGDGIKDLNGRTAPLVVGYNLPGFISPYVESSKYTLDFQKYAASQIEKSGVFSPLTLGYFGEPNLDGVFGLFDFSSRRLSYQIGERDVDLHFQNATAAYVKTFNEYMNLAGRKTIEKVDLTANNANNSFLIGSTSNLDLQLGNGNNVVIASPSTPVFLYEDRLWDDGHDPFFSPWYYYQKVYSNIFYPSAQGLKGSNSIALGNGNNLVYYDSSFSQIKTGDGNNIFVPSFGSFNWSFNDLQYPRLVNPSKIPLGQTALPADRTFLSPIPVTLETIQNNGYSENDLYTLVYNMTVPSITTKTGKENAFLTYQGNSPSAGNNRDNIVGGTKLIGGLGDDTFYGSDPSFYDTIATRDLNIYTLSDNGRYGVGKTYSTERKAFDEAQSAENKRLALQKYETIEMLGGGGDNTFILGNPTHLKADGADFIGRFSYKINVGHQNFASEGDLGQLSYGSRADNINSININLSANANSYTLSTASYEQTEGQSKTSFFQAASSVKTAVDKYSIIGGELSKSTFAKLMRAGSFAYSAVTAVIDTVGFIKDYFGLGKDPDPIQISTTVESQPLGLWRQAVMIDDWNPNVAVNIKVDPTITLKDANPFRWKNIKFQINAPGSSSQTEWGVTVSQQQGSDPAADLLFLKGFGSTSQGQTPGYGYYGYDFALGKSRYIDQSDLAFFGDIAYGVKDILPLKNYKASNGFVFSSDQASIASAYGNNGTYSFYWNDPGINPITGDHYSEAALEAARNAASNVSLRFDSRKLGWFWDLKFKADPASGTDALAVDDGNSKLWIKLSAGTWTPFSFQDLDDKPLAYTYALKANTFYQTSYGGVTSKTQDQITTEKLVDSLTLLDKLVPDLNVLSKVNLQKMTYLSKVNQITFVTEGTYTPEKSGFNPEPKTYTGDWIYHVYGNGNGTGSGVYKVFVHFDEITKRPEIGLSINKNFQRELSNTEVYQTETRHRVDIDLDGIVGAPAITIALPADGDLSLAGRSPYEYFLKGLYRSVLNREPDAVGLKAWTEALASSALEKLDVTKAFLSSAEFSAQRESPEEFVELLYMHMLRRAPDVVGKRDWIEALDRGLDYSALVQGFANSEEFMKILGAAPAEVIRDL